MFAVLFLCMLAAVAGYLKVALVGAVIGLALSGLGYHPSFVLAAMGGSFTNVEKALKFKYDTAFRGYVGWSKGVLAAMINKVKWGGRRAVIPIRIGNSAARSADFVKAKLKASTKFTPINNFELNWAKDFAVAKIDGLLMDAASDSDAAMFDDLCAQVDGGLDGTMHSFSTKIYRNGFGAIGVIDATTTIASQNIILQKREDLVLFENQMDLVFSQSDHGHVLRNAGATVTVDQISDDGTTATVHITTVLNVSVAAIAVGDTIFPDGDRQDSATPSLLAIPGLDAWLGVATTTDFTNVNRSLDFRLQGTRIDATGAIDEEQALIAGVTEAGRYGGRPKWAFLNPTRYQNLVNLGMTRFRPTTVKGPAGIGFSGVVMQTSYGEVEVYSDPYCPVRRGFIIDPATFKYYGAGSAEVPRFLNHDKVGNILRDSDDDGVQARMGYYGTTGCNAPIKNVVITFEAGA